MRWSDLYIAGSGCYFPARNETAEQAIAAGRYSPEDRVANGIRMVRVANEDEAPPVMAAEAGRRAVARSGHAPEDFCLVLHACLGHQGQDLWTPAHFVQRETVGAGAAIEVRQGSNGGLAALELAASYLAARPAETAALITTADAFHLPYIDRWATENQQVYGDGATALVLSSTGGFASLMATATRSAPELEPMYRGAGWTTAPHSANGPIDLRARTREYLLADPFRYDLVIERIEENLRQVVADVLDEADMRLEDVRFVLHPAIGQTIVDHSYWRLLGVDRARTGYDWALDYGHLGAGDQFAALNMLVEGGRLNPGDLLLAVGAGIGYMWTAAVIEVTGRPGVTDGG